MRIWSALDGVLQAQRGHLFPWAPVFFGLGIGLYFCSPQEPGRWAYLSVLCLCCVSGWMCRRGDASGILAVAVLLCGLGFCYMGARSHWVAAPVLEFRYYGAVEGQVIAVDRSASDAPRITLRAVRLDTVAPARTPTRVRLSLFAGETPVPGAWVMTTAHLSPPQSPAEPGGFDFRRHAWFLQLGAVGYSRVPVLQSAQAATLPVASLRRAVSDWVRAQMPPRTGGVAAALITGDRAAVPGAVIDALRASNLAHLLAISGLHMGLFAGLIFATLRRGFALWPRLALRYPIKKIAACFALVAGFGYLLLSGANVATERAFIMVAMMLLAVVLDRRALSIRAVAIAALLVLLRRPETLLSPGFQMSFAATLALVCVFQGAQRLVTPGQRGLWGAVLRWGAALVVSSLVAGLATAPFGAAHFNMVSHYGLVANLLAVPVMGAVVVPGAVLALCLAPLGASAFGFWIMSKGLSWILTVAETVAGWPGARGFVVAPDIWVLPVLVVGGLMVLLWQGRLRWVGALPVCLALAFWPQAERPQLLVSADGGIVGLLTDAGRAVSRPKGKAFDAGIWLENDGDGADQRRAFDRWPGGASQGRVQVALLGDLRIVHAIGKAAAASLPPGCTASEIVILSVDAEGPEGGCRLFTPTTLRQTGSLAIDDTGKITASQRDDQLRLWSGLRK